MGVDLILLPMTLDYGESAHTYTTLELERRRELWPLISDLPAQPVPPIFESLVSPGPEELDNLMEGNTQADNYEEPLVCVYAKDLLAFAEHPAVQDNHLNRAAWAYLAQLPEIMRVALYWT